jgi:hypothetical protein
LSWPDVVIEHGVDISDCPSVSAPEAAYVNRIFRGALAFAATVRFQFYWRNFRKFHIAIVAISVSGILLRAASAFNLAWAFSGILRSLVFPSHFLFLVTVMSLDDTHKQMLHK